MGRRDLTETVAVAWLARGTSEVSSRGCATVRIRSSRMRASRSLISYVPKFIRCLVNPLENVVGLRRRCGPGRQDGDGEQHQAESMLSGRGGSISGRNPPISGWPPCGEPFMIVDVQQSSRRRGGVDHAVRALPVRHHRSPPADEVLHEAPWPDWGFVYTSSSSAPASRMNSPSRASGPRVRRSSASRARARGRTDLRARFRSTVSFAIRSSLSAHPGGRSGNPASTARCTWCRVPPSSAR